MEYILTSNQHEINNDCLRYSFQKPIRFNNQYISLISMVFYNYFENITDKFRMVIKDQTQSLTVNFTNGAYYTTDISKIINEEIKDNFNDKTEEPIKIINDLTQYAKLIIVKENWELKLDKNFMNLFGFEKKESIKYNF